MWHLKTRLGTFWVVEEGVEDTKEGKYFLGINDEELGAYSDANSAAKDVHDQSTGYFNWDCQSKIKAPDDLQDWVEGEPENWSN